MFVAQDLWQSNYNAVTERNTVQYILADRFDDIHIADLKETFENCVRVDSLNTLTAPFNHYNLRGINLPNPVLETDSANKRYVDLIASKSAPRLFSFEWHDYILNDNRYKRADLNEWISGIEYKDAYNMLLSEYNNGNAGQDIIGEITVDYKRGTRGQKIVVASQASNIDSLFDKTGVAWYYVIDTSTQRFKLPRTKFGFNGIRSAVGDYIEAGIPNITGGFTVNSPTRVDMSGAFTHVASWTSSGWDGTSGGGRTYNFDASRVSSVYKDIDTVQERSTEMYLYFYLGGELEDNSAYRGTFNTKSAIPSDVSMYLQDEFGSRIPKYNDYIIITHDETNEEACWEYKYVGTWSVDGINGWIAYKIVTAVSATVRIGEVRTLDPNQQAYVENVGSEKDAVLNFGIPKGEAGSVMSVNGVVPDMAGNVSLELDIPKIVVVESLPENPDANTFYFVKE